MAIWLRIVLTAALLFIGSNSNAQELVKVPVQIPAITPAVTAFAVARERGYYQQEGLDVQLVVMPSGLGTQALLGGNVKFSTAGGAGLMPILRGAPVRFMFTSFSRPMFWLYARSDIRSVESLKGKKVGVSSLGSGPDSLLREILKKHGLDGGRDVAIMPVGSGTARFYALQAGSVDAAMLSVPANLMAQEAGFRELVNFTKQDLLDITGSIIVPDALSRSDPAVVEKFTRGTLKGFIYARENRAGTTPVLARNLKIKEDMAGKILDLSRPAMTVDGTISREAEKRIVDDVLGRVGLKDAPPLDRVFNFSLARKIRAELDAGGWKP